MRTSTSTNLQSLDLLYTYRILKKFPRSSIIRIVSYDYDSLAFRTFQVLLVRARLMSCPEYRISSHPCIPSRSSLKCWGIWKMGCSCHFFQKIAVFIFQGWQALTIWGSSSSSFSSFCLPSSPISCFTLSLSFFIIFSPTSYLPFSFWLLPW